MSKSGSTVNPWSPTQLDPQCLVLIVSQHFHSSQPLFQTFSFQHYLLNSASFLAFYFMLDNLNIRIFISFPPSPHTTILLISSPILTSFPPVSEKVSSHFQGQLFFLMLNSILFFSLLKILLFSLIFKNFLVGFVF